MRKPASENTSRRTFLTQTCAALGLGGLGLAHAEGMGMGATVVVATKDSSEKSKAAADFVGDGQGDQLEINAAIRALPPADGTVLLMEGTFDIRKVEGKLGGVIIDRSHVFAATVTGNTVQWHDAKNRLPLWVTGANIIVTGNYFENVALVVDDKTGTNKPIIIKDNVMENSVVEHKQGNLKTS